MKKYQAPPKIISLCLATAILFSLVGCGKEDKKPTVKEEIFVSEVGGSDDVSSKEESVSSATSSKTSTDDKEFYGEITETRVSEYGAVPNDGKDDGEAIRRAIRKAVSTETLVTVNFDPGVYNIASTDKTAPDNYFYATDFEDLSNIAIKGNGATIMVDNPLYSVFCFSGCEGNLSIDGLNIDYSVDPWAQGEVTAINKDAGTFTFRVNNLRNGKSVLDYKDCWSVLPKRDAKTAFGMVRDDANPLLFKKDVTNYFFGCQKATKISDGLYTIEVAKKINGEVNKTISKLGNEIVVGSKLVLNARINNTGVFNISNHDGNITVTNCNVYASIGTISIIGGIVGDVTYDNVDVKLKDGRWTTSNADGFYSGGVRGKVSITNCEWEGLSDDCLNLFITAYDVTGVSSSGDITIKCTQRTVPKVGDIVTVSDPSTGTLRDEATVTYVQQTSPQASNGAYVNAIIRLDKNITSIKANNDVIVNQQWQAPGTKIENNVFTYGRNRGLKINSINTTVRGNKFENITSDSITIQEFSAQLKEHGCVKNCIIENNTFTNCAYLRKRTDNVCAPIVVFGGTNTGGGSNGYVYSDIKILNNVITNVYRSGIYVCNAKDVTISGNKITGLATDDAVTNIGILLNTVENVAVDGNTITDPRNLSDGSGIKILENSGKNITCSNNVFNLAVGVVQIDDKRN